MEKQREIRLTIDAFRRETLPMSRLAQYLTEFSELLGNSANVHFSEVQDGSAQLVAFADYTAIPKIQTRLNDVVSGRSPKAAAKAYQGLDDLLAEDNAIAEIQLGSSKLIEFPGRRRASRERLGPIRRNGSIEGQIYQVGGRDETINIHLRNKDKVFRCEASIDLARRLVVHLLAGNVRLFGEGEWYRVSGEGWKMSSFTAKDFVLLDPHTLGQAVESIRGIFADVSGDSYELMSDLRHG